MNITTKTVIIAIFPILLFSGCNHDELNRSEQRRDSLRLALEEREDILNEREATLNDFIESFNEVERNLDCVAVRQHLIYSATDKSKGEMKGNQRDRINAQISAINDFMDQNRKTISTLEKKLRNSSGNNRKLQETISTLRGQLEQKDAELAALNEKLNALNMRLARLETALDSTVARSNEQARTIEENLAEMHTAYYRVGRGKELRDARIIDRRGGLLGLGRSSHLSSDFRKDKFKQIDYTKTTVIPVNSKQVRLVTTHPGDSYSLENDKENNNVVASLVINNPQRFWSASRFLVIEGNPVSDDGSDPAGKEIAEDRE